jgi:hypothetical protein
MRFVIAAFVAWSTLGLDCDKLNRPPTEMSGGHGALVPHQIAGSIAAPSDVSRVSEATSLSVAAATEEPIERAAAVAPPPEKNFCEALREAAEQSEIPLPFFARLLWQESRFQASEVSPVGAQGVAQFMPSTAAEVGLDDPFDPFKALPASAKYLRQLRNEFGNLGLAAAAYNAGSGRVQKWLSGRATLPRETKTYVHRITGTPAENWVEEAKTVSLRLELPDDAPCEGVGGLSRANELAAVSVALAPSISDICRKVRLDADWREAERSVALARNKNQHLAKKQTMPPTRRATARGVGESQSLAGTAGSRRPAKTTGRSNQLRVTLALADTR